MSEEQILQQDAPAAEKTGFMKKIMEHKLLIFLPAAVAVVAVLLGYFIDFLSPILSGAPFRYIIQSVLTNLVSSTGSYITALLLPAAVIVAKKVNKPILTKVLFFVSLGFLAVQLLSAFICLILSFFSYGSVVSALDGFFGSFRGSGVLSSLVYMVKALFNGGDFLRTIGYAFVNAVAFLAELLFVIKNVLCGLLCLQMMKKN